MWGPGPWGAPMWGFWWVLPLMGFLMCLVFAVVMARVMTGGRGFGCMGGHRSQTDDEHAELRREIRELRGEIERLRAPRPGA